MRSRRAAPGVLRLPCRVVVQEQEGQVCAPLLLRCAFNSVTRLLTMMLMTAMVATTVRQTGRANLKCQVAIAAAMPKGLSQLLGRQTQLMQRALQRP